MTDQKIAVAELPFSRKLRDVVVRKGLTQPQVIRILGRSSVRTVQDWMAERRTPHRDVQDLVLLKLMKARAEAAQDGKIEKRRNDFLLRPKTQLI